MTTPTESLAVAYRYIGGENQIYPGYLKIVPPEEGETTGPITLIGHAGSEYRYYIASADQGVDPVLDENGDPELNEDGTPKTQPRPPLPVPPPDGRWEVWPDEQQPAGEATLLAADSPTGDTGRTATRSRGKKTEG